MHHLLKRQIKKILGDSFSFSPELEVLLKVVSNTYHDYDQDRELLEHSFDISSKEFLELHSSLLAERTLANDRLLELDKVKTEFISVAAHQLRTPFSAIKWSLSLVLDENAENLTAEQRSLLLKGYESNERAINLINKMLVVTRIESGKMEYNLILIHIEDLIDAVLLDFTEYVQAHAITLVFEKPETPLPYVRVDSEKIRAVIQNLVENALYYTKDGGTVTLYATSEHTFIKVSVKDNGIGIPLRQQLGIFNKFFRADNATKARTDGSGLGLFVAKSIIDTHSGKIGFESEENIGSTFYFTLPIAVDQR